MLGKRRLEQLVAAASGDIDSFCQQHIPVPSGRDVLLIIEVDGKVGSCDRRPCGPPPKGPASPPGSPIAVDSLRAPLNAFQISFEGRLAPSNN
ncbi:hypothetical protein [Streptomyces sp. AK02-04a]|uniref:hypothetical protein n=1 Tax=Streptomyces sp. AK02-04a TaxID=3028649 RepID=UPI0029AD18E6|nr:hypothetical protein [Streptomyces sp. AK02-04a]MDX3764097.1 hypothetical protein [Streptomyces sp. AK02-04a]